MLKCIIKIQSFARMIIAGNKYLEMQTKQAEKNLWSIDRDQTVSQMTLSNIDGVCTSDQRSDGDS